MALRNLPSAWWRRLRALAARRKRLVRVSLAALLIVALVYGAASWLMAREVTKAERKALEQTPASVGLAYREVDFPSKSERSITLRGWVIPARNPSGFVIMVHGLDNNRVSDGVGMLDIAQGLVASGFSVLLFDLRGHGESGSGRLSGGQFEQDDVLGAFDYVVEKEGVPPQRIGVLGFSMGGAVSLLAAGREPRLQAVVADSAFANVTDLVTREAANRTPLPEPLVRALRPGMTLTARMRYGIKLGTIAPERAIARLPYPVLLIHGLADERVPPSHVRRLKAAARHPGAELWLVPEAAHARAFRTAPAAYIERVSRYFRERFRGAPSTTHGLVPTFVLRGVQRGLPSDGGPRVSLDLHQNVILSPDAIGAKNLGWGGLPNESYLPRPFATLRVTAQPLLFVQSWVSLRYSFHPPQGATP